ncbi:ABC transporter ATP-binding protein [Cobetia sp. L2A1]|uniref:ABC transporter ATP-binding protein n=1 Tax=Cobetia sp. L2A1 TaxID=2686360 RepID=UPI00131E1352|nr:ATP-binding cassette domain-containing protein [Cobetia sp. L2A1]
MSPPTSSSSSATTDEPSSSTATAAVTPCARQALLCLRDLQYRLPLAACGTAGAASDQGRLLWRVSSLDWRPAHGSGWVHLKGDNGSGKTTLLRVLAGMQSPSGGELQWADSTAKQVRYLHQQPYLFDTSVSGNLVLAARWQPQRRSPGQQRDQVEEMLAWSGLSDQARQPARSLSGGERARLALARAWLSRPPVLLLDEPAANLDQAAVEQLATRLVQMCREGCAVILSSHQDNALSEGCSARWTLAEGRLHTECLT